MRSGVVHAFEDIGPNFEIIVGVRRKGHLHDIERRKGIFRTGMASFAVGGAA